MILTEADAKTRWCPFVRFHGVPSDDSLSNRDHRFDDRRENCSGCLGSACMAWRWNGQRDDYEPSQPMEGYCGLAGSP